MTAANDLETLLALANSFSPNTPPAEIATALYQASDGDTALLERLSGHLSPDVASALASITEGAV
jgi:hypothetical protein